MFLRGGTEKSTFFIHLCLLFRCIGDNMPPTILYPTDYSGTFAPDNIFQKLYKELPYVRPGHPPGIYL
ncbi:hypothetical protein H206_03450 [Candidatus Electrothrix aarhusensis]|uniref:Uncharacterized protein n=1 Tax=Candidatus Electrothrix aarhusensis TaxID=1859131 RepID=A0A3S3QT70_9BACT|nr:hypothetical protein H206_03450 [Candidatus Electrothrix aarhusensis]